MPLLLPLATFLTAALTVKTIGGTAKTIQRRKRRKERNGN